jgi:hypothetical protein
VLLRRGFYSVAQNFLNLMQKHKVEFKEHLNLAIKSINRDLDELEQKYRFDETDYKK